MMAAVIIVAILAAIAIPLYTGYIQKAKAEEAKGVIGVYVVAEKAYKQIYGQFTNDKSALNVDEGDAPFFIFAISNISETTFKITATVNSLGVGNGLPAGGDVWYDYDMSRQIRGEWGGSLY